MEAALPAALPAAPAKARRTSGGGGGASGSATAAASAASRRLAGLLLPLLFVLLLPSLRLEEPASSISSHGDEQPHLLVQEEPLLTTGLLLELVRLPLDRLRFSAGLVGGVHAARPDNHAPQHNHNHNRLARRGPEEPLQEEETGQLAAEHRQAAAYLAAAETRAGPRRAGPVMSAYPPQEAGAHLETQPEYGGAPSDSDAAGPVGSVVEGPAEGGVAGASTAQAAAAAAQARADLPAVRALNVKCEKNHMTVNIVFDRPFYGTVFSKGHYNDQKCVHLAANSGQSSVNFDIHLGKCGMSSSDGQGMLGGGGPSAGSALAGAQTGQQQQPNGLYIENTIIIQYDPQVQEVYDQARRLRCTWYDFYEKSVTFRPYNVDMLDAVTANFLGDNIQCWMQIQVGKGPWSSEVAGIVKIGQTMTMVLAIKDDENRFDMLVRNCQAHDGKHQPIQLVDEYGCVARPKIMGRFQKVRNFGPAATVVSYAHFQAFKFPDSMSVHFQCTIQVCRYECPEPRCEPPSSSSLDGSSSGPNLLPTTTSGAATPPDYAVSGSETVASKELVPAGLNQAHLHHAHLMPGGPSANHSSVQLRLDESQGRVQVKLDTSMLAGAVGGGVGGRPQAAALPPHLLHAASSAAEPALYATPLRPNGPAHLLRPRPPTASANGANTASPGSGRGPPNIVNLRQGSPAGIRAGGPAHFSPALGAGGYPGGGMGTSGLQHRLGELALDGLGGLATGPQLSLIAQPRALNPPPAALAHLNNVVVVGAGGVGQLHRKRRATHADETTTDETRRQRQRDRRHLGEGTAVKTQRTIQVVSPDDVAFALSPAGSDEAGPAPSAAVRQRSPQPAEVCFSAARLALAALVTLAALAASLVAAGYLLLRQRARAAAKLREPAQASAALQRQLAAAVGGSRAAEAEAARQRAACEEELRQRQQTYLARLYAQLVPNSVAASQWR